MFICKHCKSTDKFELMFSSAYKGSKSIEWSYDRNNDILIKVDDYEFVPDLNFMNKHAVCRYCGQIYMWEHERKNG